LLGDASAEAITDTLELLFLWNVRVGVLDLKEELYSLDRGDNGL